LADRGSPLKNEKFWPTGAHPFKTETFWPTGARVGWPTELVHFILSRFFNMFSVRYVFWGIARPTKKAASVNCDATNPKSKFLEFFFGFGKKVVLLRNAECSLFC
jgi:hypothetical protein